MKPEDKFGRSIYPKTFLKIMKYGELLTELGWKESRNKHNLFYKKFDGIMVFADMRGTEIVPIWEDPRPLIYVQEGHEDWKRRRALRYAIEELESDGIPYRFSFYDAYEPDGLLFGEKEKLPDGKCKLCGKEINHDGLFCSENCERAYSELEKLREEVIARASKVQCAVCGKTLKPEGNDHVIHHVDYDKQKTIHVCRGCHLKIHLRRKDYPNLAPQKPKSSKHNQMPNCTVINGRVICPKCKAEFASKEDFENHWKARHVPGRKPL